MAAAQVDELTRQLEQLGAQALQAQAHPGSKAYFVQLHLERLRAELMVNVCSFRFLFLVCRPSLVTRTNQPRTQIVRFVPYFVIKVSRFDDDH